MPHPVRHEIFASVRGWGNTVLPLPMSTASGIMAAAIMVSIAPAATPSKSASQAWSSTPAAT